MISMKKLLKGSYMIKSFVKKLDGFVCTYFNDFKDCEI